MSINPDSPENEKNADKRKNKWIRYVGIGLLILIWGTLLCLLIIKFSHFNDDEIDDSSDDNIVELQGEILEDDTYQVEYIDAEEYYEENSEIVSIIDAAASEDVLSEQEVLIDFGSRGFDGCSITYNYSIDGEYGEEEEVQVSTETHPVYESIYLSESGEIWILYSVNGSFMASPFSYNMQSTRNAEIIIAESETIASYDSATNQYFITIPDETELIVVVVDEINNVVLNEFTIEALDEL